MTLIEVVREECAKFGFCPEDDQVEYIIWEKTGYPDFWPDKAKTPEENFRQQIREWAQTVKPG